MMDHDSLFVSLTPAGAEDGSPNHHIQEESRAACGPATAAKTTVSIQEGPAIMTQV